MDSLNLGPIYAPGGPTNPLPSHMQQGASVTEPSHMQQGASATEPSYMQGLEGSVRLEPTPSNLELLKKTVQKRSGTIPPAIKWKHQSGMSYVVYSYTNIFDGDVFLFKNSSSSAQKELKEFLRVNIRTNSFQFMN